MARIAEIPKEKSLKRLPIKRNRKNAERIIAVIVFVNNSLPKTGPSDSNFNSV